MAGMYEHNIDRISSGHKIYVFSLGILLSAYFCMHVFTSCDDGKIYLSMQVVTCSSSQLVTSFPTM